MKRKLFNLLENVLHRLRLVSLSMSDWAMWNGRNTVKIGISKRPNNSSFQRLTRFPFSSSERRCDRRLHRSDDAVELFYFFMVVLGKKSAVQIVIDGFSLWLDIVNPFAVNWLCYRWHMAIDAWQQNERLMVNWQMCGMLGLIVVFSHRILLYRMAILFHANTLRCEVIAKRIINPNEAISSAILCTHWTNTGNIDQNQSKQSKNHMRVTERM